MLEMLKFLFEGDSGLTARIEFVAASVAGSESKNPAAMTGISSRSQ